MHPLRVGLTRALTMPVSVPRNFSSSKHITGGVHTSSLRYDLRYLGGSWAQRQVFSITLIQAAINSKQLHLALALVAELKVSKHIIYA